MINSYNSHKGQLTRNAIQQLIEDNCITLVLSRALFTGCITKNYNDFLLFSE